MNQRILLEPAFVLHRRPYSNTSFILELLTEHYGRISVFARSARGLKSRYKGNLELFFPLLVSWSGQRELKILGNMELNHKPYLLEGKMLICGFYLNELLLRLLHREDPCKNLFFHYQQALADLFQKKHPAVTLRKFEKNLLQELGYGLPLHCDIETGLPIEENQFYHYFPERGFSCQQSTDTLKFSGKSLLAFREDNFAEDCLLREIKQLTQIALSRLLGNKPLKSRELLI